jgi:hypothetical protein
MQIIHERHRVFAYQNQQPNIFLLSPFLLPGPEYDKTGGNQSRNTIGRNQGQALWIVMTWTTIPSVVCAGSS